VNEDVWFWDLLVGSSPAPLRYDSNIAVLDFVGTFAIRVNFPGKTVSSGSSTLNPHPVILLKRILFQNFYLILASQS
jgi:hypothetical protein